jgi:hypothetical protein
VKGGAVLKAKKDRTSASRYFYTILGGLTHLFVHEGVHIVVALLFGVYEGVKILPIGIEVLIEEPLTIGGYKLAVFSGLSSILTIVIGYGLLMLAPRILKINSQPLKKYLYYVTLVFLLLDPIYLSLISFFVGGDINGIVLGLNIPYGLVRAVYFAIAVYNLYLVIKKLYPAYVTKYQT